MFSRTYSKKAKVVHNKVSISFLLNVENVMVTNRMSANMKKVAKIPKLDSEGIFVENKIKQCLHLLGFQNYRLYFGHDSM